MNETLSDARLREIEERLEAATPGPWWYGWQREGDAPRPVGGWPDGVTAEAREVVTEELAAAASGLAPGETIIHTFSVVTPWHHVTARDREAQERREYTEWLCRTEADARLFANARDDLATLVAEVRRLRRSATA